MQTQFPKVELPQIPERIYRIEDYGAVKGGDVSNTEAIRNAIEAAHEAGGGRVFGRSSASGSGRSRASEIPRSQQRDVGKKAAAAATFAVGDAVDHKIFGRGKVVKVDGDTLHIRFAKTGTTKKLLKDYAPIVKVG